MRKTSLDGVFELAKRDERVVFIGSDLGVGALDEMKQAMPHRFFMEGVAEANLIGMAAGMAMEGYIPYVNTIGTFLTRRCFEQIAVDLCLHNLPVRLIANGGGLVYAPLGPTHQAIEDLALMRALPNMAATAVSDAEEMKRLMAESLAWPGPLYIRLGKGGEPVVSRPELGFKIGRAIELEAPGQVAFISTGVVTHRCLEARKKLEASGIRAGVLHVHTLKPLDHDAILRFVRNADVVVTVEEHVLNGGLGSAVVETLCDAGGPHPRVIRLGIPDCFADRYGSQDDLLRHFGLDVDHIVSSATHAVTKRPIPLRSSAEPQKIARASSD